MVKKILCVAEKPSIAKAVAGHLAGGHVNSTSASSGRNGWLKNYTFEYNFPQWGQCQVVMTSVAGHLQSHDFEDRFKGWRSCAPEALFSATVNTFIEDDKKHIATNIERNARGAEALFIWTDCDREGEHIGTEISNVATRVNNRLLRNGHIVRARFSNTERQHIIQAARNPINLDDKQAEAVAARIELDLRIGACFTRMQTLSLQAMVQSVDQEVKVISYGSCQFPTLGFVVDRYFQVQNFVPEPFWSIKVVHNKDKKNVKFSWARVRLFDRMTVVVLFEQCLLAKLARVTKVQDRPASKWKPLPLTTVELQKMGSRFLRMDSRQVMKVAETLYQKGWISYPRTETDQFDRGMDLRRLIDKQTQSPTWGQHAQGLINGNFSTPRNGRNNDKAHPPIHPVNYVDPSTLQPDEKRVHEFVVRRFLACCSEDAKGMRSEVEILYGRETFKASGLTVLERNYLDVYPYEKWTSTDELPRFEVGETFEPTEAQITDGKTVKPGYLTEPELIGLMDANGIGTDATMAEHIATIKERRYVMTQKTRRAAGAEEGDEAEDTGDGNVPAAAGRGRGRGRSGRGGATASARGAGGSGVDEFIPTTLGVALYDGYEKMGLETSLTKPFLRKEMELKMKAICEGRMQKQAVIEESLTMYREVYVRTQEHMGVLRASIQRYVLGQGPANGA